MPTVTDLRNGRDFDGLDSFCPQISQQGFKVTTSDGSSFSYKMPSECNAFMVSCGAGQVEVSLNNDCGNPTSTPTACTSDWSPASRTVPFGSTLYFYTPLAVILSVKFYRRPA